MRRTQLRLEALDERAVPDATPTGPPMTGNGPGQSTSDNNRLYEVTADEPVYIGVADGNRVFLTGTADGTLWLQLDAGEGNESAILMGQAANTPAITIPRHASPNFIPTPGKPTLVFDPATGTWTTYPAGSRIPIPTTGYPNGITGGWDDGIVNIIVPPSAVTAPPAPAVAPPKPPAPPAPANSTLPPINIVINGTGNTIVIADGGRVTIKPPSSGGGEPKPVDVAPPAAPPKMAPPTVDEEEEFPGGMRRVRKADGTIIHYYPNGTVWTRHPDGSTTLKRPPTN